MTSEPRSGSVALGGFPWLARMIDKARLAADGTIAQYDLDYPCPMDGRLLSELGLNGKEFQQIAVNATSDEEILAALKEHGVAVK